MSCMMSFFFVRLKNDESASRVRHVHTRDDTRSLSKKKLRRRRLWSTKAPRYIRRSSKERERERGRFFYFCTGTIELVPSDQVKDIPLSKQITSHSFPIAKFGINLQI